MATSSIWTLSDGALTGTAPDLGIAGLARKRATNRTDTCTFRTPGRPFDATPLFSPNDTVTVRRNGVVWFVGRVTTVPRDGLPRSEAQSYELSGPWWYLEKIVCRQQWCISGGTTATALSTRLILGQALNGARLTTGGVITETLQYAISCGAPLQIGTIDPDLLPPFDEVKDVTCADVIRQMLRWHPDCVAWFDYTTGPYPTLHIRQRANLTAVALTVGVPPLSEVTGITARTDLQPPAVVIHYEITGSSGGKPTFELQIDAAPVGATGAEFGAACFTIPLRGTKSTSVQQRIVTRSILDSLSTYSSDQILNYLMGKYGALAVAAADPAITADGLTITQISRGLADPTAKVPDPSGATVTDPISGQQVPAMIAQTYDASLTQELVEGSVTDWMRKNYAVKTQVQRLTFTWTADSGSGGGSGDIQTYQGTVDVTATNAGNAGDPNSSQYSAMTDYDPADAVPVGVAAAYLAGLSTLQYSGSVALVENEASGVASVGNTLNLLGGAQGAWNTMAAPVLEEAVDVDLGTTTLTFGPLANLKPQDLVTLLTVARPGTGTGRAGGDGPGGLSTQNSATRTSGSPASGNPVVGGVTGPTTNACSSTPAAKAAAPPTPFQFLQTAANSDTFALNINSYFRANATSSDNTGMTGSTTPITFASGLCVWLQQDFDDSGSFTSASIQNSQTPPYQSNGGKYITFAGAGTAGDPYIQDQAFTPLCQVFDADASGKPVRGGIVYQIDTAVPPTKVEVVQQTCTHLALRAVIASGAYGYMAFPDSAPLLS